MLFGSALTQLPELSQAEMAVVGVNIYFPLRREIFFNRSVRDSDYGTRYIVSAVGRPDMPPWLRLVQDDPKQPAFVYGTPQSVQDSTDIAIVAVDRKTHITSQKTREIKVNQLSDQARYFVDLRIRNLNLGELFERDLLNDILVRMRRLWPSSGNIYITKVATFSELGERLPVPDTPGAKLSKEGVRVQVGGTGDFSNLLKRVELEIEGRCNVNSPDPYVAINERFYPDYVIDWCRYRLITPHMMEAVIPVTPAPAPVVLRGQDFDLATAAIGRREFYSDFLVTVVFPIIVAIVLSILLSLFFFCSREGVEKRDEITPDTQLSQFNTIRRATTNLRLMSQRREGPPPLRAPAPTAESVDPVAVSPVRFEDEHVNENQRLVVRGSPIHSGNDNMAQQ